MVSKYSPPQGRRLYVERSTQISITCRSDFIVCFPPWKAYIVCVWFVKLSSSKSI